MASRDDEFVIKRAERTQVRLRIALQGSSGGGKTATSILLARGMVDELRARGALPAHLDCHIGLLDTERDSAKLYSHLAVFDTIVLMPPYSPARYLKALAALEHAGYSVIIVDQITHEWFGEGGVLSMVADSKEKNDFAKWNGPSQEHELFIDSLLKSPAHLIVTMRSKTAWVLEEEIGRDGVSRKKPKRIGMAAKQREGTEYEFTTLMDLSTDRNIATCMKDRTELFEVGAVVPADPMPLRQSNSRGMGIGWGHKFIEWVYSAKAAEPEQSGPSPAQQCTAIADASIRGCDRAENLPDLQVAFEKGQRDIRAFQPTAGAEVVRAELARLVAAKDARKAAFGASAPQIAPGEEISPEDLVNLETLISDTGVDPAAVKTQFQILRLAALPLSKFDECQTWIVSQARHDAGAKAFHTFNHQPSPPPAEKSAREVLDETVTRIGNARGGLFGDSSAAGTTDGGLSSMDDDIPWDSEGARPK